MPPPLILHTSHSVPQDRALHTALSVYPGSRSLRTGSAGEFGWRLSGGAHGASSERWRAARRSDRPLCTKSPRVSCRPSVTGAMGQGEVQEGGSRKVFRIARASLSWDIGRRPSKTHRLYRHTPCQRTTAHEDVPATARCLTLIGLFNALAG